MPLLFAIAGVAALLLATLVLVAPVLLVVGMVKAIRSARPWQEPITAGRFDSRPLNSSPLDTGLTDSAFADLIQREWPDETKTLRGPTG